MTLSWRLVRWGNWGLELMAEGSERREEMLKVRRRVVFGERSLRDVMFGRRVRVAWMWEVVVGLFLGGVS